MKYCFAKCCEENLEDYFRNYQTKDIFLQFIQDNGIEHSFEFVRGQVVLDIPRNEDVVLLTIFYPLLHTHAMKQ